MKNKKMLFVICFLLSSLDVMAQNWNYRMHIQTSLARLERMREDVLLINEGFITADDSKLQIFDDLLKNVNIIQRELLSHRERMTDYLASEIHITFPVAETIFQKIIILKENIEQQKAGTNLAEPPKGLSGLNAIEDKISALIVLYRNLEILVTYYPYINKDGWRSTK